MVSEDESVDRGYCKVAFYKQVVVRGNVVMDGDYIHVTTEQGTTSIKHSDVAIVEEIERYESKGDKHGKHNRH